MLQEENLKKPELHTGQVRTQELQTKQALQPYRVASVTTVVLTATLASTVTGGHLPSTQLPIPMPGTGTCTTITAMSTESTT